MNIAVISSNPDHRCTQRRWCNRVDDAKPSRGWCVCWRIGSSSVVEIRRHTRFFARHVLAYLRPAFATVRRFIDILIGEIERVWIRGRKDAWLRPCVTERTLTFFRRNVLYRSRQNIAASDGAAEKYF